MTDIRAQVARLLAEAEAYLAGRPIGIARAEQRVDTLRAVLALFDAQPVDPLEAAYDAMRPALAEIARQDMAGGVDANGALRMVSEIRIVSEATMKNNMDWPDADPTPLDHDWAGGNDVMTCRRCHVEYAYAKGEPQPAGPCLGAQPVAHESFPDDGDFVAPPPNEALKAAWSRHHERIAAPMPASQDGDPDDASLPWSTSPREHGYVDIRDADDRYVALCVSPADAALILSIPALRTERDTLKAEISASRLLAADRENVLDQALAREAEAIRDWDALGAALLLAIEWDGYDETGVPAVWLAQANAALATPTPGDPPISAPLLSTANPAETLGSEPSMQAFGSTSAPPLSGDPTGTEGAR